MSGSVVARVEARWHRLGRHRRELAVDTAAVVICGALGVGLAMDANDAWCNVAAAALLAARRKTPSAVLVAISAIGLYSLGGADIALICALYTVGAWARPVTGALAVVATSAASAFLVPDWVESGFTEILTSIGLQVVPPVLVGAYVRRSRQMAAMHRDQAVARERDRIAREMHDVLGHKLSLISLHAGRLELGGEAGPETARLLGGTSRAAMRDLRQIIGVLDAEPVTVEQLVESSRRAGLRIESALSSSDLRSLPPELSDVVRRVVQEALTNVHKHAGPVDVAVEFEVAAGQVRLRISNGPAGHTPGIDGAGTGRGLRTLAAQISVLGGRLTWGPRPDGGFGLTAILPAYAGAA